MFKKSDIIDYFKEYENLSVKVLPRRLTVPLNTDFIISIIGPRRSGKTYFLLSLWMKTKDSLYLNFEDTRLESLTYKEIRDVLRIFIEIYGKVPEYLFLDEIQNIENWERIVRELHDLKKYKIFLTGSSSKLLSREIATQLRGRSLSFILLPLSFKEFLTFKGVSVKKLLSRDEEAGLKNLLREYIEFGGFPDVVKNREKINILKEYLDLILFRDFIERHKVRNINLARMLHSFVLQNFAREISINRIFERIKSTISVAKDSVYEYVTHLEDTMFFFFLKKFSKKAQLREGWPKKIYICDTGLAKIVKFSPDHGRLIENTVFLELIRQKNENPLLETFYLKFPNGEVDFLVRDGLRVKRLIQVTYAAGRDEVEPREIKSLLKAAELFKKDRPELSVITWDYEDVEEVKGKRIKFIPLWKWLLNR